MTDVLFCVLIRSIDAAIGALVWITRGGPKRIVLRNTVCLWSGHAKGPWVPGYPRFLNRVCTRCDEVYHERW